MTQEEIDAMVADAKGRDEGSKMIGPNKDPVKRLKAIGVGAAQGLTWGGGAPTVDRMMSGYNTGNWWKDLAANAALATMPGAEPIISSIMGTKGEVGPVESYVRKMEKEEPASFTLGTLMGGLGSGGAASAVGRKVMKETAEAGIPYVSKTAQKLVDNWLGRVAGSGAAGAGEGGIYALNTDADVGKGSLFGAAGGAGGQAILGEIAPFALSQTFLPSNRPQKAATFAMSKAREAIGVGPESGREFPVEEAIARRKELGPEATLLDVNPGFRSVGEAMAGSSEALPHSQGILYRYGPDSPRAAKIAPEFEHAALDALSKSWVSATGKPFAPRTMTAVRADSIANRKALQPVFEQALESAPGYKADEVRSILGQRVDMTKGTAAERAIYSDIQSTIDSLTAERRRIATQAAEAGAIPPPGELAAEDLLIIRRELDQQANKAMKAGDRALARSIIEARNGLSEHMVDTIPGFGSVNARYSNEFSYERAYESAHKAFKSNNLNDDDLRLAMDAAAPADLPAFMEGATQAIFEKIDADPSSLRSAREFFKNRNTQAKLNQLFGQEATDALTLAADRAITFAQTGARISGASRTQFRSALAGELEKVVNRTILGSGIYRMMTGRATGIAPSTAATVGAAGREAKQLTKAEQAKMYPLIDAWLSAPGEAADRSLMQMNRLSKQWYPSTSISGRNFDEPYQNPIMDMMLRSNLGNTPAQALALGAAEYGTKPNE